MTFFIVGICGLIACICGLTRSICVQCGYLLWIYLCWLWLFACPLGMCGYLCVHCGFIVGIGVFTVGICVFTDGIPVFTVGICVFTEGIGVFTVSIGVFIEGIGVFTEGIGVLTESIGVFIVGICGRSSCLIICCYFRFSLCLTNIILLIWTAIADIFVIEFCSSQIVQFLLKVCFLSLRYSWSKQTLSILFPSLRFLLSCLSPWVFMLPMRYTIIWVSNISAFGVRDEDYSRNASCTLNYISTLILSFLYWQIFSIYCLVNPQDCKHLQVDVKSR